MGASEHEGVFVQSLSVRAMPCRNFQLSVLGLQLSVLLAFSTPAFSQATFPSPVLTSISPLGAKPGTTLELTLRGTDLDGPEAILLGDRSIPVKSSKPNVFSLALPADIKPALYDLRFVGRYGVSNPRVFELSTLDAIDSTGANARPDKALKVGLNTVVQGCFKSNSPHWFVVDMKQGQHLTASFDGHGFDTRTELVGALSTPSGRELARMRHGVLSFTAAADASYRLCFNELMFRTGDDYGYRVTLSSAAPPAVRVVKYGEAEPLQIGQTVRDYFLPHGLERTFDLSFKAGEQFIIEVHSHQLGHSTDPHLFIESVLQDAAGKETLKPQAEIADATVITPAPSISIPNRDPVYAFTAKADGKIRITLNDNFNTTLPFELDVVKEAPKSPALIALNPILPGAKVKGAEIGSANVPRQGIAALEVIALNRNALSEPIELRADKLPAGVTCLGGFIGRGQSLGYIAFQASADAPAGACILDEIPQSRFVSFSVVELTRDNALYRTTGSPALGVSTQPAPAFVQTEKTDIFEVAADAKLDIALKVTRHADFTDALKLKVLGLVDAAKAPDADIPAKAATGKFTLDVKALKLAPGDYGFILQGPAKMKFRRNSEVITQVEADIRKIMAAQTALKKDLDAATVEKDAALIAKANTALQANDAAKAAADETLKEAIAKSVLKEATFVVYSNPIRIRVKEAAKK